MFNLDAPSSSVSPPFVILIAVIAGDEGSPDVPRESPARLHALLLTVREPSSREPRRLGRLGQLCGTGPVVLVDLVSYPVRGPSSCVLVGLGAGPVVLAGLVSYQVRGPSFVVVLIPNRVHSVPSPLLRPPLLLKTAA